MAYYMRFLVKDTSTELSAELFSMLLYTHEGLGKEFFPWAPESLYTNSTKRAAIEKRLKKLMTFNVWVDAIVERKSGFYFIKETSLREI